MAWSYVAASESAIFRKRHGTTQAEDIPITIADATNVLTNGQSNTERGDTHDNTKTNRKNRVINHQERLTKMANTYGNNGNRGIRMPKPEHIR
jgi:hypothetical protein